ncbi:MAG: hypothetical protein ACON4U_00655 [Myxococcota bacterium]
MAPSDNGEAQATAQSKSEDELFDDQRITRNPESHQAHKPITTYNADGRETKGNSSGDLKNAAKGTSDSASDNKTSASESDVNVDSFKELPPSSDSPTSPKEWANWAKARNWEFYPETQYARMAMHGTYGKYVAQIFARRLGSLEHEPRDETEFRIQLLNGMPEGLYVGPIVYSAKASEIEPESKPTNIADELDPHLMALTQDPDATRYLMSHTEVRDALTALIDAHPLSRINNRMVSLRKIGIQTDDFDDWVDKVLYLVTTLDNCVNRAWESLADKYTLKLRPPDRNGYPALRGKIDGHQIKINLITADGLSTYIRVSLGSEFPHDLTLIGSEYAKPDGLVPLKGVDYGNVATAYADYPERAEIILNDENVKELLTFLFRTIPKSDIQYGELRLRINGRLDDALEGVINESISIAKMLFKASIPDHVVLAD